MAANIASATDEILGLLNTKWIASAQSTAGTSYVPQLVFEANERDLLPHPSLTGQAWARATLRHSPNTPATALGGTGLQGTSSFKGRFRRNGLLYVEVYFPNDSGESWQRSRALATLAQTAYEGRQSSNVTFKTAAVAEKGQDGAFYRCDMIVTFYWDEIK